MGQRGQVLEIGLGMPVISIMAPVYNEAETLPHFYAWVVAVMEWLGEPFELVLVNDGSNDGSSSLMWTLQARDPRVVIDLSRNFGHQMAISARLAYARWRRDHYW